MKFKEFFGGIIQNNTLFFSSISATAISGVWFFLSLNEDGKIRNARDAYMLLFLCFNTLLFVSVSLTIMRVKFISFLMKIFLIALSFLGAMFFFWVGTWGFFPFSLY